MSREDPVRVPRWPLLQSRSNPANGETELSYFFGDAWRFGGAGEDEEGPDVATQNARAVYLTAEKDPVLRIRIKGHPFLADPQPYTWDLLPPVAGVRSWPIIRLFLERAVAVHEEAIPVPNVDASLFDGSRYTVYAPEVQIFRLQREGLISDSVHGFHNAIRDDDATTDSFAPTVGPPDPLELIGRPDYWYHSLAKIEEGFGGSAEDNPLVDPENCNPLIPVAWIVPEPAGVTISHACGSGDSRYSWRLSIRSRNPKSLDAFAYCFADSGGLDFEIRVVCNTGVEVRLEASEHRENSTGVPNVFVDTVNYSQVPEQGEYLYFRPTGNERWKVPTKDELLPGGAQTWAFRPVREHSGASLSSDELAAIVAFELALGLFPPAADAYDIAQFAKALATGRDFYGQSVSGVELAALGIAALLPVLDSGKLRATQTATEAIGGR